MKKTVMGLLVFFLAALPAYQVVVFLTPYAVQLKVKLSSRSEFNKPVYANIITEKDRYVPLPNPDFIYAAGGYDIRKTPVRITGAMPDGTYCSVALYASNTLNYFIQNDRQLPGKKVDILLVQEGDEMNYDEKGAQVVFSPSSMGTMLVRILINDTSRIDYLKEIQKTFRMEVVN